MHVVQVPSNLSATDTLYFNISLLLPQSPGPTNLHVANFLTSLPYFTQNISVQPSQASFGNVALGGYKAPLYMDVSLTKFVKSLLATSDLFLCSC